MARTQGTSARVQRLTSLVATLLVGLAVGFAFGRVFQGRASTLALLGAGVVSALLAWAFERRGVALGAIVSVAALVVGLGVLLYLDTTWYGLPTLATLKAMGHDAALVGEQAREQISPVPAGGPLLFASTIAVWAAVFSCHSLAFRAGSPILALLPPIALVAFADSVLEESQQPIYGIWFLVAGLAVLFADSMRRVHGWGPVWNGPGRRDRLLPAAGFQARRLAAGAVAIALIAPVVVPGFGGSTLIDLSNLGRRDDGPIQLSTLVSMGAILTNGEDVPLFRVHTPISSYYRLTAYDTFDGVGWGTSASSTTSVASGQALAHPLPDSQTYQQDFTVLNDVQIGDGLTFLPAGYSPERVTTDRALTWDPVAGSLALNDLLHEGETFTVDSTYVTPSRDDLRAAGVSHAFGSELTRAPGNLSPEIKKIAVAWTDGFDSDFAKVMAIQDHLTNLPFHYDESVQFHDDSASTLEFLNTTRRGFCQHFATAMAVLLRSIGIPARIAVGFAAGSPGGKDEYEVTSGDLHSWVEVPFTGYGFLMFEPTPGFDGQNEQANSFQESGGALNGTECPPGRPCPGGDRAPKTESEACLRAQATDHRGVEIISGECTGGRDPKGDGTDIGTTQGAGGIPAAPGTSPTRIGVIAACAAGVLVLITVPLVVAWRRRRTIRKAGNEPRRLILATYDVFTQRAAQAGMARRPGETPEEYRRRLIASERLDGQDLRRLTALTVQAAYAPVEPSLDDAHDARADAESAAKLLRRSLPIGQRIVAVYRRR